MESACSVVHNAPIVVTAGPQPSVPLCVAGHGRYVVIDGQPSNKVLFTYSPPTILSLTPNDVPTTGYPNAELIGDSFGDCTGMLQCYLRVHVSFPAYSIPVDLSDKVG